MNESTPVSVFGFVPLSQLEQLNPASPKEEYNFLLNLHDFHDQMKENIPTHLLHAQQQLGERISLLSQVAIITGKTEFIKAGQILAKTYAHYSPNTDCLENSKSILEHDFNENWFIELQKIALIWKKSHVFAKHIKKEMLEGSCKILEDTSFFIDFKMILCATQAYEIQKKGQSVLAKWQHVLKSEYGLIEPSKVSHLGSLININKSYKILLDCTILLEHLPQPNEQLIYHISRRIIALASAALLTNKQKYFLAANALLDEAKMKIEGNSNEDLDRSATYLLKARFIAKDLDSLWKNKWPSLQLILEKNPKTAALLGTLDLSILKINDLESTLDKYLLVKQIEKILCQTNRDQARNKRERSVSFENEKIKECEYSPRDESGSSTFNSPRDESGDLFSPREEKRKEIKKLDPGSEDSISSDDFSSDTDESQEYKTNPFHVDETEQKDNDGTWEISKPKNRKKRKSKEYLAELKQLQIWLVNYYPSIYDLYISTGSIEPLKDFLEKYNHNLLLDFFDDQEHLYCTATATCLFHDSATQERRVPLHNGVHHPKIFNLYIKALEKPGISYLCLEYFLINNNDLAIEYLNEVNFFNFLSFIYHKHYEICSRFLEEHQDSVLGTNYIRKLKSLVRLKPRKVDHVKEERTLHSLAIPQFSSNLKRRKLYLYLLHRNNEFYNFLKTTLTFLHSQNTENVDEFSEILLSHVAARLEDRDKNIRASTLKTFDILNSILTLSIYEKNFRKPKMLASCYNFFLQNHPLIISDYLKNDIFFNFFRFVKENHLNILQCFFIDVFLKDLKDFVLSIDVKSKRIVEPCTSSSELPAITNYSSSPFTRAKQYTHLLLTNRTLQIAFSSILAEKLESLNSEERCFEIQEKEALLLKKSSPKMVKIKNDIYKIINLDEEHKTVSFWEIKLLASNSSAIEFLNHKIIEMPELSNKKLNKSILNSLIISRKTGLKIDCLMQEETVLHIRIGSQIFKVISLNEKKEVISKWKLTTVLLQYEDSSKKIIKIKNSIFLKPSLSIVDIIGELQNSNLKVRKKIVKQLDTLRSCFPEQFSLQ